MCSVVLERLASSLIEGLRKSLACKTECKKLEELLENNKHKLERLARGLDKSKKTGQVWIALDEWCKEMKELLVRADIIVHKCQSGSALYNEFFSAHLTTEIAEIRTSIENKFNHATVLETTLAGTANVVIALQQNQFQAANTMQHGHYVVQTTYPVAPLQHSVSMPNVHTMHPSTGWTQHPSPGLHEHYWGPLPSSVHLDPSSQYSAGQFSGNCQLHHCHSVVGMHTVEHDRRHSCNDLPGSNHWLDEVQGFEAQAQATRELHRRHSISVFPHHSTLETSQWPPVESSTPPQTFQYYSPSGPPLDSSTPPLPCSSGAPYGMMHSPMQ